ncbi:hypothetical protein ACFWAY_32190 [Rhodococcus sp. NPDC059968]|uniref:hypothetical protein n=1 Tax=Rhodococcus sp. NPDC059968 TaxID=3347017 RepID=UPI00366CC86D
MTTHRGAKRTVATDFPGPEVDTTPGQRALEFGTHYIEELIWVYLMRDWDSTDRRMLDLVRLGGC